tara:strand:+ start:8278 stop:8814 length:537 start_codon:yes stop_codon:yes gene_type:complete
MPFLVSPFVQVLQTRLDPEASVFSSFTEGDLAPGEPMMVPNQPGQKPPPIPPLDWATVWSDATVAGAGGIIPPSATVSAAGAAMKASLLSVTSATPPHMGLKTGFVQFAAVYIGGTLPAATTIPPPGPGPAFESIDGMGMNSETNAGWLNAAGNTIMTWFMQGTALWTPNMFPVTTWL